MTRAAVALLAVMAFAAAAPAQGRVPSAGTEILRGLLKYTGFRPVKEFGQNAAGTLVVVVGPQVPWDLLPFIRQRVMMEGGGLLVIADREFDLGPLLPAKRGRNQAVAVGPKVVRGSNRQTCFNGDPTQPLLQLQPDDPTKLGLAKGFGRGTVTLATRNPHAVVNRLAADESILDTEVAKFPAGAHFAGNEADDAGDATLALMSDPDDRKRTAMAYADRAMFTNGLMVAKDENGGRTDNFAYAYLVAKYLADRVGAGRGECLFIEDGRVRTDFDAVSFAAQKLPPGGIPRIPPALLADLVLDKANEFVAKMEDRDLPNAVQNETNDPRNRFREVVLATLAIVGAVVLARYLLARGWRQRVAADVAPRVRIDPERGGGLIPERRLALIQSGNLYDPLRDHLRFVFAQWGVPAFDADRPPPIALDRKTRPRQRITTDLTRLWDIAAGPHRTTVTPDDLEDLEEMIADLASAHQKGIWRFAAAGGKA